MKFYFTVLLFFCGIPMPLSAMEVTIEDTETDEENRISSNFDTTWLREKTTKRLPEAVTDQEKKERIVQQAVTNFIDDDKKNINYKALTELLASVTNPQDTYTSLEKGEPRRNIKNDIDWLIKEAIVTVGKQDTDTALTQTKKQKIQKWIFVGLTGVATLIAFLEPSLMAAICKGAVED